ncbi:hypothetical protein ACP22Q_11950, partial [Staphylococcus epidermidis]
MSNNIKKNSFLKISTGASSIIIGTLMFTGIGYSASASEVNQDNFNKPSTVNFSGCHHGCP